MRGFFFYFFLEFFFFFVVNTISFFFNLFFSATSKEDEDKTLLQMSRETYFQKLDPSDLPPLLSPLIQNLYPFLLSLDNLLSSLVKKSASFLPSSLSSSSSSSSLFQEKFIQNLISLFELRVYLSDNLDQRELNKPTLLDIWNTLSLHVKQLLAPILSNDPKSNSSSLTIARERDLPVSISGPNFSALLRDIFHTTGTNTNLEHFLHFYNAFEEQIFLLIRPETSIISTPRSGGKSALLGTLSSTIMANYQKRCGNVATFRCQLLFSLFERLKRVSRDLFSHRNDPFNMDGSFSDPLPLAVRLQSDTKFSQKRGDIHESILEGIGTIWKLNGDPGFVAAIRSVEEREEIREEQSDGEDSFIQRVLKKIQGSGFGQVITDFSSKVDLLRSVTKVCEFLEKDVAGFSSVTALSSVTPSLFKGEILPELGRFQFKPELVGLFEDLHSLRTQFSVTPQLLHRVMRHFSQFGKSTVLSGDGETLSSSLSSSLSSLSEMVAHILNLGGGLMKGTIPPTDFVPFLLLLWELNQSEEERKRERREYSIKGLNSWFCKKIIEEKKKLIS